MPKTSRKTATIKKKPGRPKKIHDSSVGDVQESGSKRDISKDPGIAALIASAESKFGQGAILRAGAPEALNVIWTSMEHPALNHVLGKGLPDGRLIEIYGPESSGKTTMALHFIACYQRAGHNAAFIDVEHALDTEYAEALGVDIDNLLLTQPDSGEDAMDIAEMLVKSAKVKIVVIDSVAALATKAELEGDMGDSHVGRQARLMSIGCKKLIAAVKKSGCVVVFINQLRDKIGIAYGNPETTSGGRALKFYASIRIDVRKGEFIQTSDGKTKLGHKMKVKAVKNKVAPPYRTTELDLLYPTHGQKPGFDIYGSYIDSGLEKGVLEKRGSWIVYKDERLGQGRLNTRQCLAENSKLFEEIKKAITA